MNRDLLFQLALTEVPKIGHKHARTLLSYFKTAEEVFAAPVSTLARLPGINNGVAASIKSFKNFRAAETELRFIEKYKIETYFINDEHYPKSLLHCEDPPVLLFYRGNINLDSSRMIAIIGTRSSTEYGRMLTDKMVKALQGYDVVIVSGLAFGIDACAHKAAIRYNIPTIGVLGHGLDTLYPPEHSSIAKSMIRNGGLLSEFKSNTKPDKYNFPSRNRIVAGLCKAVIVVESGIKGGSLITADLALGYHRDVYAFPGRVTDTKSTGCNLLIKENKAAMINDPQHFIDEMHWDDDKLPKFRKPRELFDDLNESEKILINILKENGPVHIDELMQRSGFSSSTSAAVILGLELKSIVATLPGKKIALL